MVSGDIFKCEDCSYDWQTKKQVGEPAFCPDCRGRAIINKSKTRREREKKNKIFRKKQKSKGLVFYRNKWISISEKKEFLQKQKQRRKKEKVEFLQKQKQRRKKEKVEFLQKQKSKGLVFYRNKWISISEKEEEREKNRTYRKKQKSDWLYDRMDIKSGKKTISKLGRLLRQRIAQKQSDKVLGNTMLWIVGLIIASFFVLGILFIYMMADIFLF
jgi:hypothetical protein